MRRVRVLLADDHTLLHDAIRLLLEQNPEFEFLGAVTDGHQLLETAERLRPDLVLLDISMPLLNGIDAARELRGRYPGLKLVMLTMHCDVEYVSASFRVGASGYVVKTAPASELLTAMRTVVRGGRYVSSQITPHVLELIVRSTKSVGPTAQAALTPRRRQVLQLVAEGRSRKQIADLLKVSVKTVEFHKAGITRDLNLRTHADYTRYAIKHGIIS